MTPISVLHIDTGTQFRGGQRQVLLLTDRLGRIGIRQAIAVPGNSALRSRLENHEVISLAASSLIRKLRITDLVRTVQARAVSIIHAHDSESHTIGLRLKRLFPRVKLVVTRRVVFPPSGFLSRRWKYGGGVDIYIAVSRAVAAALVRNGIPEEKIVVIPSALDIGAIASAEPNPSLIGETAARFPALVASAGALTAEKDFATAIRAVHLAGRTVNGIGLIILGEGPERKKLLRLVRELGADNIVLPGYREPLAPIFKCCRMFLLTSTSEGLNTAAIEAAACALPLVVSNVGGLPELVADGDNGRLCSPGDAEAFARAITDILADGDRRQVMGNRSALMSKRFEAAENAARIVDLYNRLLAQAAVGV